MNFLISGSSGMIGSSLVDFLRSEGHRVIRLVRRRPTSGEDEIQWDPDAGVLDAAQLEGLDAVVHLGGESIADGRWTRDKKTRIRESRVAPTRLLAATLAQLNAPPKVLVTASAIGFYGDRGDEVLHEMSEPGIGFLPEVCSAWEQAALPAASAGIRVVNLRIGMVLSRNGGALAKMLGAFRIGAGGKLGDGQQWVSWIALDDCVGAIHHCVICDELAGPVNAVSPSPVTNQQFTKALGRVLRRPTLLPMPAPAARLAFGEIADALLLASTRVEPVRLLGSGFTFRLPEIEGALSYLLGRSRKGELGSSATQIAILSESSEAESVLR